jgi:hypothetical protein
MRTTCLRCEQEGVTTALVRTARGGICPVHEPAFLQRLYDNAKLTLGIPRKLELAHKGIPAKH